MATDDKRADFPTRIRRLLADRAGHRCSAPECGQPTIGPGPGSHDVSNIGTASHIFSASTRGPRGSGGLSDAQRRDVSNGIWLCATHGRLVDNNYGGNYPPALLQGWRSLHEARCRQALNGVRSPFGWIEYMRVKNAPVLGDYTMTVGSHNLVIGDNGAGKTMLLELLTSGSNPERLERLTRGARRVDVELRWHAPDPYLLSVIADETSTRFTLNGSVVPLVATPYQTIDIGAGRRLANADAEMTFGLPKRTLVGILQASQNISGGSIHDASIDENGAIRLAFGGAETARWIRLGSPRLSANESIRAHIDTWLAVATARAQGRATLVVFDEFLGRISRDLQSWFFHRLTERPWPFQVIATSTDIETGKAIGADWLVTHLRRRQERDLFHVDQDR